MKAALDAGHGAKPGHPYTGASANGLVEDELALDFIRRLGHHLRSAGWETVLTRPGEEDVGIVERARAARYAGADVFVSVHCNAGPPSACGIEAFAVKNDNRSRALAEKLVDEVAKLGMKNRGVKWDTQSHLGILGVIRGTYIKMPAVLLEIGFITNPHDAALLANRHFRESAAKAVAGVLIARSGS